MTSVDCPPAVGSEIRDAVERLGFAEPADDAAAIESYFDAIGRDPTSLELQVLAQTWSEHCKHRIFGARIEHTRRSGDGESVRRIDGLFDQFIRSVTEEVERKKPGFVLSAFEDNAGFIRLDDDTGVCMKVETHNHPSALAPTDGASTGLGGVIRDILGAGKGAEPVASLDVFCLGMPDDDGQKLPASVLLPETILRGVVRGVSSYGNRIGLPTVAGALHFDRRYTCNPLVYCGCVGLLPVDNIDKTVAPGMVLAVAGAPTRRVGLGGATFASAALSPASHTADRDALQTGDPIEERKLADFVVAARRAELVQSITDCGAGGLSSAIGEMVAETGAEVRLDRVPLGEDRLSAIEIFLSESQERMVLAVDEDDVDRLGEIAAVYETTFAVVGAVTDSGRLNVQFDKQTVCDLETDFLHNPPRRTLRSVYDAEDMATERQLERPGSPAEHLADRLGSFDHCSRAPIIRQYDFEVRGDTLLKPLAGASGDAPQGAVGLRAGNGQAITVATGLCPRLGDVDPYTMGRYSIDQAVRKSVAAGADPARIGLLDNFSMGDPEDAFELGRLVECVRGMSEAARALELPFISGKDSFYNYFTLDDGRRISIPPTLLVSAVGIAESTDHLTPATLRHPNSTLGLVGPTTPVSDLELETARRTYAALHRCITGGWILAARAVGSGGLALAMAKMAFSMSAGLNIDLSGEHSPVDLLYSSWTPQLVVEIPDGAQPNVVDAFDGVSFAAIGHSTDRHMHLRIRAQSTKILDVSLAYLKRRWKDVLSPHC